MTKKSKRERFSQLKKSVKSFVKDEHGFVTKDKILAIGLGAVSALSIISSMSPSAYGQDTQCGTRHTSGGQHHTNTHDHRNMVRLVPSGTGPGCHRLDHWNCQNANTVNHDAGKHN